MTVRDYTRWNRAGRRRVAYTDGNAVRFLADLRTSLAQAFPELALPPLADADDPAAQAALYATAHPELIWQLHRALARAAHVLAGHVDAVANESWIGTATQWESLRRLVAMLDYSPRPPASAETPLVILAAADGRLEAGFAVRHMPSDGSAPIVFETLADLELRTELNALRPVGYGRNPAPLPRGDELVVEGVHGDLKVGEPLLLEDRLRGRYVAMRIRGAQPEAGTTRIQVTPALPAGFALGETVVHLQPAERLAVFAPLTRGGVIGRRLRLQEPPDGIVPGELLVIGTPGRKPVFVHVREVGENELRLSAPVGELDLAAARIGKPVELPVSFHKRREADGDELCIFYLAGDWRRLKNRWLARHRRDGDTRRPLPVFRVVATHYDPPDAAQARFLAGYTRIVLAVDESTLSRAGLSARAFANTQAFLMPPESPGPWRLDAWLEAGQGGVPPMWLDVDRSEKLSSGDFVVLQRGDQQAWARLDQVESGERTRLRLAAWQHRGGGPWYRAGTRLYGAFGRQVRPVGWARNDTPLSGASLLIASRPEALLPGREVLIRAEAAAVRTRIARVEPIAERMARLLLDDPLPPGATVGNVILHGNVVTAGHGETRPETVLGSGTGQAHAQYVLEVDEPAFVSDATRESGVRAAITLRIDGRAWQAVDHFRDAGPTDPVFRTRMNEDGRLVVQFGDGIRGRRVPAGRNNLRVVWRQGHGAAGNLPASSLEEPVRRHWLVAGVLQPMAAGGGAAMESADNLRESAPATVMTLGRAVSLRDFAMLARSHSAVWQARAFARPVGLARNPAVDVVVVPAHGDRLTPALAARLAAWLRARALPGIGVRVLPFQRVPVRLSVSVWIDTAEYESGVVARRVRDALLARFNLERRRLGQPLYRSEVQAVIEAVPGVLHSRCELLPPARPAVRVVRTGDGIVRMIDPGPRQCAWLASADSVSDITVEAWHDD